MLLTILNPTGSQRLRNSILLILATSVLFGLVWFILIYGFSVLNPTYTAWIYNSGGDVFQHQIGWEFFRQEAWQFPLGWINAYGHPFGTSVSYTDSIPLLAFFFKLVSPLLSENFQYLGLWALLSTIGQLFFGMLIIREVSPSYLKQVVGASLLVFTPALIYRAFYHDSLSAHWILLVGIWLTIREFKGKSAPGAWVILFCTSILIHLYFVVMLLPFWGISLFFRYKNARRRLKRYWDVLISPVPLVLISFSLGLFRLSFGNLLAEGYGYFSWNLNGLINPLRYSSVLHPLQIGTEGQLEGFSYLGLGVLLLLPVAILAYLRFDKMAHKRRFLLPFAVISILFILIAISNKAYINSFLIWNFPLPKKIDMLVALFRASGRFIWPVSYCIILFAIISIIRNSKIALPLLILALIVQVVDLQPLYNAKRIQGNQVYTSPLQDSIWESMADANQHVFMIPASKAHSVYEPLALYARQNNLTLNWGYFSRANLGEIGNLGEETWQNLLIDQVDPRTIYIFWKNDWKSEVDEGLSDRMIICDVDGYTLALSKDQAISNPPLDISGKCSIP